MPMFKNLFFDLDGTILQTITDIRIAINEALGHNGLFHDYSDKDVVRFIGDGADMLVRRAMKEQAGNPELFAKVKASYMPLYKKYQNDHAKPFPFLIDALKGLKNDGCNLYVVTNKPHELACYIVDYHFGSLFSRVEGHREGMPVKPDPVLINRIIEEEGLDRSDCLFLGDSITDINTAENAHVPCCLCLWGYGNYDDATLARADYTVSSPDRIVDVVNQKN